MKYSSTKMNLRAQVINALLEIQEGRSLSTVLDRYLNNIDEKNKALFHQLILGTLRQWHSLKAITLPLLEKPLQNPTVETCLYLGIYQILCTRTALHAALSETVDAVKQLGFATLSGVVNAILRRVSNEEDFFLEQLNNAHGLPSWLYKRLKKDWPEQVLELSQNLKQSAPLTLRINQKYISRTTYLNKLSVDDIITEKCVFTDQGISLPDGANIKKLVGFEEGLFSVQDEHAQLCADLLPNLDDKFVIDACAAPGGKTCHILEKYKVKTLTAIDYDENRLFKIQENLDRLRLKKENQVRLIAADASEWQSEELADVVVLDAPCSATGVIRRHPDIRLLRQPNDILQTVELQKAILNNMWSQLKVGGHLLYITCSILKVENVEQIENFLSQNSNAEEVKLDVSWGIDEKYGRQLLPKNNKGDGFYYCLLEKVA